LDDGKFVWAEIALDAESLPESDWSPGGRSDTGA
jgi:hypothetical protein